MSGSVIAASLLATPEIAAKSSRMSSRAYGDMASSESCDDQESSHMTQDSENSPLATALTLVLMNAKGRGLTSCEALRALTQGGYLKNNRYEHQALASHVKTTLKKCPLFKELKNHRFILKAGQKLASSSLHSSVHDQKFSERELSISQVLYSQKRERSLTQLVDHSLSRFQQGIQRHETHRDNAGYHLQLRATTSASGCSSCEVIDSCDAYNERRQGAKEEGMLATILDNCSGQSAEDKNKDQDRAHSIRCCRTDGKSWQCSNEAQEGSTYCVRHQGRSKKGMVTRHVPIHCESKEKGKLQSKELSAKNQCVLAHELKLSMQLRPRSGAAGDICLQKL
ncbi:hypothetical protein L7F22_013014 [Adiantum nelumboides]|nr:hypothetical protein [Adiantum nelumboides]